MNVQKELLSISKSISETATRLETLAQDIMVENTKKVSLKKVKAPAKKAPKKSVVSEDTPVEVLAETTDGIDTAMHDSAVYS
jgi:hypothetical protein